jgi:thymidylate synthase
MKQYLDLIARVLATGIMRPTGAKVGEEPARALTVFGEKMMINLKEGFPLLTTKKLFFRGIVEELCWFLRGSTDVRELQAKKVHIWDEWATESGDIGPGYGLLWRNWDAINYDYGKAEAPYQGHVDQIAELIDNIHKVVINPADRAARRLILTAWDPYNYRYCALPPCHCFAQFDLDVRPGHADLSCQLYIRSNDLFLGNPYNIASYSLLTHMLAAEVTRRAEFDVMPHELHVVIGNAHIYENHIEQCREQLTRAPLILPELSIITHPEHFIGDHPGRQIHRLDLEPGNPLENSCKAVVLEGYVPHPALKGEVAV